MVKSAAAMSCQCVCVRAELFDQRFGKSHQNVIFCVVMINARWRPRFDSIIPGESCHYIPERAAGGVFHASRTQCLFEGCIPTRIRLIMFLSEFRY
jgi:hypothetical protein